MMDDPDSQLNENDIADFKAFVAGQIADWREPQRSDLERYLRAYPGRSARDWQERGLDCPLPMSPGEPSWSALPPARVREMALRHVARELSCAVRQAAGRDPDLVWNPLAAKYRLRLPSDPQPPAENPPV